MEKRLNVRCKYINIELLFGCLILAIKVVIVAENSSNKDFICVLQCNNVTTFFTTQ